VELVTYGILGVIGCGLIASCAWFYGYFKRQSETQRAREQAEIQSMRADNEKRSAEIFALPTGDKPDIIGRL
jgi:ABC-type protease/lipase transport system fused ATPase/permease subunit